MSEKILLVDDESLLLRAYQRQLGEQFDLHTALGPEAGLQVIAEQGPFAVVVSDMQMPGMDGIQFLTQVRKTNSNSVRVMLSGDGVRIQGDKEVDVKVGDFWCTPGGVQHAFRAGPKGARLLDVFSPPREEYRKAGRGFASL